MYPALDALRRRPGRSALAALGIGLSVALVVVLLAVSAGIESSASELAAASGVDLLGTGVNASLDLGGGGLIPDAHTLASAIPQTDPNVETASPWLISGVLDLGNASLWADANRSANGTSIPAGWMPTNMESIGWIPSDTAGIEIPPIYSGAGFSAAGDPHYADGNYTGPVEGEVVLDQGLAAVLGVGVNDLVWAGSGTPPNQSGVAGWYASAQAFRVVGISGPFWLVPSAFLGFFYLSELQQLLGGPTLASDGTSLVLIHLFDNSDPTADAGIIEGAFRTLGVVTLAQILGAIQNAISLYRTFGDIVGAIGLIVAALFATTVLLMGVDDRSREIALRRAVGFGRLSVGWTVLEESVLLSLLGLAVGLPLALLGADALNAFLLRTVSGLPTGFSFISFNGEVIGTAVAVVLAIALAASIAPATRAMQLPIAEELRAP